MLIIMIIKSIANIPDLRNQLGNIVRKPVRLLGGDKHAPLT